MSVRNKKLGTTVLDMIVAAIMYSISLVVVLVQFVQEKLGRRRPPN